MTCPKCNTKLEKIKGEVKIAAQIDGIIIGDDMVETKCQSFMCKNKVGVYKNKPYFGILCSECWDKKRYIGKTGI